jgi:hypothetical protein
MNKFKSVGNSMTAVSKMKTLGKKSTFKQEDDQSGPPQAKPDQPSEASPKTSQIEVNGESGSIDNRIQMDSN